MFLPAFELLFLKPTIASIAQRGEERRRRPRLGRSRTDDGYRSFRRLLLDTLIADWISLRGGFDKNRPDFRDLYLASFALTSFGEKRRGNDGLNREGVRELSLKRRLRRLNVETVGWTGKSEIILIYICIFNRLKYIYIYYSVNFIVRYRYFESAYRLSNEADLYYQAIRIKITE